MDGRDMQRGYLGHSLTVWKRKRTGVCELHFLMSSESLKLDQTLQCTATEERTPKRVEAPALEPHPITGCKPLLCSLQGGAKGSRKSKESQESQRSEGTLVGFRKLGGRDSGCLSTRAVWLYASLLRQDLIDARLASSSLWSQWWPLTNGPACFYLQGARIIGINCHIQDTQAWRLNPGSCVLSKHSATWVKSPGQYLNITMTHDYNWSWTTFWKIR